MPKIQWLMTREYFRISDFLVEFEDIEVTANVVISTLYEFSLYIMKDFVLFQRSCHMGSDTLSKCFRPIFCFQLCIFTA